MWRRKRRQGKEIQKGKICVVTHNVCRFVCRDLPSEASCRFLVLHTCLSYTVLLEEGTGNCTEHKNHNTPYTQGFNFKSNWAKLSGFPLEALSGQFLQLTSPPSGPPFKRGVQLNPKIQSKTQLRLFCFIWLHVKTSNLMYRGLKL